MTILRSLTLKNAIWPKCGKNGFILERAAQNGKMAKMALFWQNLVKTVFWPKWLYFDKICLKQWFWPKWLFFFAKAP